MQKYDSIIFDLDGTLWDAVKSVCGIWNEALVKVQIEPIIDYEKLSACMGMLIHDIIEKLIPQANQQQVDFIINYCLTNEEKYLGTVGGILYDNVEDTLKSLSEKYRLFIVSNCQEGYLKAFYKAHSLEKYFEDYECAGRTGLTKGENIRLVAQRNGLRSPVYVGDTLSDSQAATQAGVPFVFAEYGFGKAESYDYAINSFDELLTIF